MKSKTHKSGKKGGSQKASKIVSLLKNNVLKGNFMDLISKQLYNTPFSERFKKKFYYV